MTKWVILKNGEIHEVQNRRFWLIEDNAKFFVDEWNRMVGRDELKLVKYEKPKFSTFKKYVLSSAARTRVLNVLEKNKNRFNKSIIRDNLGGFKAWGFFDNGRWYIKFARNGNYYLLEQE